MKDYFIAVFMISTILIVISTILFLLVVGIFLITKGNLAGIFLLMLLPFVGAIVEPLGKWADSQ